MSENTTTPDHSGCATKAELSLVIEAMNELVRTIRTTFEDLGAAYTAGRATTDSRGV